MGGYPFISIIVPAYNVSGYIDECLQSIASQDYQGRMECMVVDDCSQDDTVDHVRHFIDYYSGRIDFTLIIQEVNSGVSAARNAAMKQVSGDYIFFVDGDDILTIDSLSTLAKSLETDRYDIVVGCYRSFGKREGTGPSIPGGAIFRGNEILQHYINGDWAIACWNKLYRTELLLTNSLFFYEGIWVEDFLWGMEVLLEAASLVVVDAITYHYRIQGGSIMTSNSREQRKEKLRSSVIVLSRIQSALYAHGYKGDTVVSDYLENCRIGMFSHARYDWLLFKNAYYDLRREMPVAWRERFHMNKWNIGRQIRDSHLAFVPSLGFGGYYVWWHMRWLIYKSMRILNKHLFGKKS